MEKLVRLTADDYEQAIDFLDLVFSQLSRPHHFEQALPRMCKPDDEHMGRHLAIKVDGRIAAMLGVYPLPVVIDGEPFLFSTTGNVATHHRYEGRGYAHKLLNAAMGELKRIGADASRLGGFRQRYNRFGFEMAGYVYRMQVSDKNIKSVDTGAVHYKRIAPADTETIKAVQTLQSLAPFYADRGDAEGFYLAAAAWQNQPFAAYDDQGKLIGYVCVSPDGRSMEELIAGDASAAEAIVAQWIRGGHSSVLNVTLPPWNTESIGRISRFCQTISIDSPSQFKIINWAGISNALCRVQSRLLRLPDGVFTLAIHDGPALRFAASNGLAKCEQTDDAPDLTLDSLTATRYLFGPQAPWTAASIPDPLASALLPLPLTWCGQDRV